MEVAFNLNFEDRDRLLTAGDKICDNRRKINIILARTIFIFSFCSSGTSEKKLASLAWSDLFSVYRFIVPNQINVTVTLNQYDTSFHSISVLRFTGLMIA